MTASVPVPANADLAAIAAEAGNPSFADRRYEAGRLYVAGVTQAALTEAAARHWQPPVPSPTMRVIWPADIWRRVTDAEAAALDVALEQAPPRLRRLFDKVSYLTPADPDYELIRSAVVSATGEARAAVILAPS